MRDFSFGGSLFFLFGGMMSGTMDSRIHSYAQRQKHAMRDERSWPEGFNPRELSDDDLIDYNKNPVDWVKARYKGWRPPGESLAYDIWNVIKKMFGGSIKDDVVEYKRKQAER